MEKFQLLNYKVQELGYDETIEITGGGWWAEFKAGFANGWNSFWSGFGEFFAAYSEVFE
jgi:hypothetical protein